MLGGRQAMETITMNNGQTIPAVGYGVFQMSSAEVAAIKPAVLQVEINPYWNQHELKVQLAQHDITFEGWYPLGHGDAKLLAEPVFSELAKKYSKTPAQTIMRWHFQEGNVTFPKTLSAEHMEQNLDIFDFELTEEELARINALPQQAYYQVPEEAPDFVLAQVDVDAAQQ